MPRRSVLVPVFAALLLAVLAGPAPATSNRSYGPDEWVEVDGGVSPDGRLAVVAHGGGDLGDEDFGLALAKRPDGTRIGSLPGVEEAFLDTDAAEYHAAWAPDSRRVAVRFRVDRHEVDTLIWSVAGGAIARAEGPDLFRAATGRNDPKLEENRTAGLRTLAWTGPDRFTLIETRIFRGREKAPPRLGAYGRLTDRLPEGGALYAFSVRAEAVFTGPATWKIEKLAPGDFRR